MTIAPCMLEVDPDISGIGVRLAFYVQAFLTGMSVFVGQYEICSYM